MGEGYRVVSDPSCGPASEASPGLSSPRTSFLAELALGELETVLREDALQTVKLYGEEVDADTPLACRHYFSGPSRHSTRQCGHCKGAAHGPTSPVS
jgi:hypothetical protein